MQHLATLKEPKYQINKIKLKTENPAAAGKHDQDRTVATLEKSQKVWFENKVKTSCLKTIQVKPIYYKK